MGVTLKTATASIRSYVEAVSRIIDEETVEAMNYFGIECVNFVRDRSGEQSWYDQTGNLRSSIGYIISEDGAIRDKGGFEPTNAPKGNGAEGQKTGAEYAETVVKVYSGKYCLSLVAGMGYASDVESRDNKDVLASCELWARREWPKRLELLKAKIMRRINEELQL